MRSTLAQSALDGAFLFFIFVGSKTFMKGYGVAFVVGSADKVQDGEKEILCGKFSCATLFIFIEEMFCIDIFI